MLVLINDLSATGASVLTVEFLVPVGDVVELTFQARASGVTTMVTTPAWVRSASQPTGEPRHRTLGLEFREIKVTDQLAVNCIVAQQWIAAPHSVA